MRSDDIGRTLCPRPTSLWNPPPHLASPPQGAERKIAVAQRHDVPAGRQSRDAFMSARIAADALSMADVKASTAGGPPRACASRDSRASSITASVDTVVTG